MTFLFNQFWLFLIIVMVVNGIIWKKNSKKYIKQNPELKEGYDKLIKGFLIYCNIPWIIMGIGMLTGITKSMESFFYPQLLNPIVLIFNLYGIFIWIYGSYWIYFKGGAEMIVKHPGLFRNSSYTNDENLNIKIVKFFWAVMILVGIISLITRFIGEIPPYLK